MFGRPTVFILGAGASAESGLPTGVDLKARMAQALKFRFDVVDRLSSGDHGLLDLLRQNFGSDINTYTKAGNALSASIDNFDSIDEALHFHADAQEIVDLGKIEITRQILIAESKSVLAPDPQMGKPKVDNLENNWLHEFFTMAIAMQQHKQIAEMFENVTIINFNYDRTLEHYLYWKLLKIYNVDADLANSAVSKLNVIRPYGSIGKLEWQESNGIKFGNIGSIARIFELAKNIRTYTEQHRDGLVDEIRDVLDKAHLVVMLGFGFHNQNLKLFRQSEIRSSQPAYATVLGIDAANHNMLKKTLVQLLPCGDAHTFPSKAAVMLRNMRPSILATVRA